MSGERRAKARMVWQVQTRISKNNILHEDEAGETWDIRDRLRGSDLDQIITFYSLQQKKRPMAVLLVMTHLLHTTVKLEW